MVVEAARTGVGIAAAPLTTKAEVAASVARKRFMDLTVSDTL